MSRIKYWGIKLLSVLFCLAVTSSCGIKTGIYNLNNYHHPLDIDEEPLRYWEAEMFSEKFADDHMDILFGGGFNSGKEEGRIEVEDDWWIPEVETYLWDIHVGTRCFPLGTQDQKIIPYAGAGIGYFEYDMESRTSGDYEYVYSDEFYDYYAIDTHHDTIAHGYFSYVSTGLYVPLDRNCTMQLEFRYDFDKKYKQLDMGGYMITLGFAFMIK